MSHPPKEAVTPVKAARAGAPLTGSTATPSVSGTKIPPAEGATNGLGAKPGPAGASGGGGDGGAGAGGTGSGNVGGSTQLPPAPPREPQHPALQLPADPGSVEPCATLLPQAALHPCTDSVFAPLHRQCAKAAGSCSCSVEPVAAAPSAARGRARAGRWPGGTRRRLLLPPAADAVAHSGARFYSHQWGQQQAPCSGTPIQSCLRMLQRKTSNMYGRSHPARRPCQMPNVIF